MSGKPATHAIACNASTSRLWPWALATFAASPPGKGGPGGIGSAPAPQRAETASAASSRPSAASTEPAVQRRMIHHRSCCQARSVLQHWRNGY
jgi:hypothetical protein